MTLLIDIDEKTLAEVDESLRVLHQDRDEFFKRGVIGLAAKAKREAEVAMQYQKAYGEKPVGPEEFFVEEEQLSEVWKDI